LGTGEHPDAIANYKFARGAAIVLGALIVIALVALIVGFALRAGPRDEVAASGAATRPIMLPVGAHIVSMDVIPGRLVLRLRMPAGEEIDVVDTESGRLVGQVRAPDAQATRGPR
jgi:uncharacterized membrane protein